VELFVIACTVRRSMTSGIQLIYRITDISQYQRRYLAKISCYQWFDHQILST
jgi:hypothetical protein